MQFYNLFEHISDLKKKVIFHHTLNFSLLLIGVVRWANVIDRNNDHWVCVKFHCHMVFLRSSMQTKNTSFSYAPLAFPKASTLHFTFIKSTPTDLLPASTQGADNYFSTLCFRRLDWNIHPVYSFWIFTLNIFYVSIPSHEFMQKKEKPASNFFPFLSNWKLSSIYIPRVKNYKHLTAKALRWGLLMAMTNN